MNKKINTALIIDNSSIHQWQRSSLMEAQGLINVKLILNCNNTKNKKYIFKNFFYYILNIFTLKNKLTKGSIYKNTNAKWIDFNSEINKNWQTIPSNIIKKVHSAEIDLIIKFGMGLLDVEKTNCNATIISFHHGDPSKYRGRPPGFYELLFMEKSCGSIIQILSNNLDGGEILAINYSKIYHYSYRKTLINLFSNSQQLLKKAISNLVNNKTISANAVGKNYRLPSNYLTIKFILTLIKRKIERYFYGLFVEKKWNIVLYDRLKEKEDFSVDKVYSIFDGKVPDLSHRYVFIADPFFSTNHKKIYAEGLNKINGLGEIISINAKNFEISKINLSGKGHFAYPQCINIENDDWILPEISDHSEQKLFRVKDGKSVKIDILDNQRIIDATIYKSEEDFFLFCGHIENSLDNLYLYYSKNIFGPYKKHPCSPIVSNPVNARMAGNILKIENNIYRFGQNNCYGYGEGITINKIKKLSTETYEEEMISKIHISDCKGPHTINFIEKKIVFDFYKNIFSLFAGYRRIIPNLLKFVK